MKILVVQGANMAYLGKRQPEIYGSTTAAELDEILHKHAGGRGYTLEIFYTHIEGEAIGRIYKAMDDESTGLSSIPPVFSTPALRCAIACARSSRRWSRCT